MFNPHFVKLYEKYFDAFLPYSLAFLHPIIAILFPFNIFLFPFIYNAIGGS